MFSVHQQSLPSCLSTPATTEVGRVMTVDPVTAQQDLRLEEAQQLMTRAGIRHLPVLNGVRLVDVVTARNIATYLSLARSTGPMTLREVMTPSPPYVCTPDTPLDIVARCLLATHAEAAVVVDDHDRVAGIFTTVDALRFVGGQLTAR